MELILFIIISIGITNIIQNENIFSSLRSYFYKKYPKIYSFIICPTCFGFWIGVLLSFFFNIYYINILNIIFCGVISSLFNKIFNILLPEKFGKI